MAGRGLTPARLVGLLCLFLAVILACVLIGLSVAIVPWNHAALVQDEIKPQIFHEVWGSGRHFIGLGKRFHAFPLDYRLVDFSRLTQATSYGDEFYDAPALVGRTADGLGVSMAVTIFCKIRREELRELFISYCYGMSSSSGAKEFTCADKVVSLVALYARAALLNLVSETRTEDFFRERVRISTEMTRVVSEAVAPLQGSCVESVVHCLTTPPHLPAWCLLGLRPLLRNPERHLSSLEACRRRRSSAEAAPTLRPLPRCHDQAHGRGLPHAARGQL